MTKQVALSNDIISKASSFTGQDSLSSSSVTYENRLNIWACAGSALEAAYDEVRNPSFKSFYEILIEDSNGTSGELFSSYLSGDNKGFNDKLTLLRSSTSIITFSVNIYNFAAKKKDRLTLSHDEQIELWVRVGYRIEKRGQYVVSLNQDSSESNFINTHDLGGLYDLFSQLGNNHISDIIQVLPEARSILNETKKNVSTRNAIYDKHYETK